MAHILTVAWAVIAAAVTVAMRWVHRKEWLLLAAACLLAAGLCFLVSVVHYGVDGWVVLNPMFLTVVLVPAAYWVAAHVLARLDIAEEPLPAVMAVAGHACLGVLVAVEFCRWSGYSALLTEHMGVSLISAAWAFHALILLWLGLAMRDTGQRYLGFVLFAVVIGKVLLVDTSTLEPVYRIVSFLATGLLAVVASYFYQRYAPLFLGEGAGEEPSEQVQRN